MSNTRTKYCDSNVAPTRLEGAAAHRWSLLKAIQLCEQLVEGLVPLIVHAQATLAAYRVQLVDENNCW